MRGIEVDGPEDDEEVLAVLLVLTQSECLFMSGSTPFISSIYRTTPGIIPINHFDLHWTSVSFLLLFLQRFDTVSKSGRGQKSPHDDPKAKATVRSLETGPIHSKATSPGHLLCRAGRDRTSFTVAHFGDHMASVSVHADGHS